MACHIQIDMSDEFSKWLPISKYSIYRCGCWSRRKFLSVLWEDVGRRGGYYWQLRFKHSLSTKFKFTWKISWYREQYVLKTITFIFRHCPNYIYPPPAPNSGKVVLLFGCQKVHWGAYHRVKFPWWWQLWKWWLWRVPQSTSNKKFVQTHASEKIYCL